jgi:hypothetical protein
MITVVILTLTYAICAYGTANAVFALVNPQGWIAAPWTARRSIHEDNEPWSDGDIRGLGVVFVIGSALCGWIAVRLTLMAIANGPDIFG